MKQKKVLKKCRKCKKQYVMGVGGIAGGLCDHCAGIRRDENGFIFEPGQTEITLVNVITSEQQVARLEKRK